MKPFWMVALLDFSPDHYQVGVEHWKRLTGYQLVGPVGDHDEFQGLRPDDHPTSLAVQRLADGDDRVHLDLHVTDPPEAAKTAVKAGASMITDDPHCEVLSSPGGFVFCFVADPSAGPAPATSWPGGHRSIPDQICIDIPAEHWSAETVFWSDLTGWDMHPTDNPEFAALSRPEEMPLRILLQRLDEQTGQVRAHIDWATTDRAAETARHVELGSHVVHRADGWTVMDGPGGVYCITDRAPRS